MPWLIQFEVVQPGIDVKRIPRRRRDDKPQGVYPLKKNRPSAF